MKRQTRPFTVEFKNTRKSAPRTNDLSPSQTNWIDVFPDDLPERDVYEDLASADKSEALTEAERVFADPNKSVPDTNASPQEEREVPVRSQEPVVAPEAEAHTPRVLPDLFAEAQRQDVQVNLEPAPKPRRKRSPAGAPPQKERLLFHTSESELPLEDLGPNVELTAAVPTRPPAISAQVSLAHADEALRPNPLPSRRAKKLPAGQRWRERRLPRVCWDR